MTKQMKRNKICFALGTIGRDALYSLVSMFLLEYLTDVVIFSKENALLIGGILTVFGIFDAVIDPLVGAIVDNTKTKWGKARPYELGAIGMTLCTTLIFVTPSGWNDTLKIVWVFCMYTFLFGVFILVTSCV